MNVEQIYTGCLAEAAYYMQSNGEAAVVDPLRETTPYLVRAANDQAKIKYIFLTHFHADFVSGHVDLAKKTGATIVFGPNATANFDFYSAKDNEEFKVGDYTVKLIHTPGHTMESSSYVLSNEKGEQKYVCTGDALFIGDVGRPDLVACDPCRLSTIFKRGLLTSKNKMCAKLYVLSRHRESPAVS